MTTMLPPFSPIFAIRGAMLQLPLGPRTLPCIEKTRSPLSDLLPERRAIRRSSLESTGVGLFDELVRIGLRQVDIGLRHIRVGLAEYIRAPPWRPSDPCGRSPRTSGSCSSAPARYSALSAPTSSGGIFAMISSGVWVWIHFSVFKIAVVSAQCGSSDFSRSSRPWCRARRPDIRRRTPRACPSACAYR